MALVAWLSPKSFPEAEIAEFPEAFVVFGIIGTGVPVLTDISGPPLLTILQELTPFIVLALSPSTYRNE